MPYQTTRAPCRLAIRVTSGSSALATMKPPASSPARISDFASAIAWMVPKNSRWTGRTTVKTATSGRPSSESWRSSPGVDIPISATIHSVPSGTLSSDRGKP